MVVDTKNIPRNFIVQPDGSFKPIRRRAMLVLRDWDTFVVIKEIQSREYWGYKERVSKGDFSKGFPDSIWVYEDL